MKTNTKQKVYTHEGAVATQGKPIDELRRSVMSCLLWEDTFYESGVAIVDRIKALAQNPRISVEQVTALAIEARRQGKLRHVPLMLLRQAVLKARTKEEKKAVEEALVSTISRADEIAEFMSLYWQEGKQPLAHCVKRGLARAFTKFDAYQLAKYDRDSSAIKLRDVMFMVHAKPNQDKDDAKQDAPAINKARYKRGVTKRHEVGQGKNFKLLCERNLPTPDTWEVNISAAGKDEGKKREQWERLLKENKLGALALLRNLRNMVGARIPEKLIGEALVKANYSRVLPFRFISAAKHAPRLERELNDGLLRALESLPKLEGTTLLLLDVSGSMNEQLSNRADMLRADAAAGLAMVFAELSRCDTYTFSTAISELPPRRGFALRDSIMKQIGGGTYLGAALNTLAGMKRDYTRLVVITDEQSHDTISRIPDAKFHYMINVAPYRNGVSYGDWTRIDGFSENAVRFIAAQEQGSWGPDVASEAAAE